MPKKVANVVEDHRLLDGGVVCEDVTTVTPPTLTNKTNSLENVSGMVMDLDAPVPTQFAACNLQVAHNNGENCGRLKKPGKHKMEFRMVRQVFNSQTAEMEHQSVKVRATGFHVETVPGTYEKGNPLGHTEKYNLIRYEEEVDGKVTTLIDGPAGIVRVDGTDYTSPVQSMLN